MLEFFKPSYISNIDDAILHSFSLRNTLRDEVVPITLSAPKGTIQQTYLDVKGGDIKIPNDDTDKLEECTISFWLRYKTTNGFGGGSLYKPNNTQWNFWVMNIVRNSSGLTMNCLLNNNQAITLVWNKPKAPVTDILKQLFNKKDVSLAMLRVFSQLMVMSDMRTIYAKAQLVKPI
jgi:hypothetical protein